MRTDEQIVSNWSKDLIPDQPNLVSPLTSQATKPTRSIAHQEARAVSSRANKHRGRFLTQLPIGAGKPFHYLHPKAGRNENDATNSVHGGAVTNAEFTKSARELARSTEVLLLHHSELSRLDSFL
jgi:hypothetical protein